ncbi:21264_t:CDS:1, partial [Racocetra persica]
CAVGVGICIATAGTATPIVASTALTFAGAGGMAGFFIGDKADKESAEREKMMMQDQRYKDARNQLDQQINENYQTQDAINTIVGKINGNIQRQPNETDEYLRNQLAILNGELDSGKRRIGILRGELDKLRKNLGGNQSLMSLLGLDKLSFADKVIIAGGIVL